MSTNTIRLASFLEELNYKQIPYPVVNKTKELFLDWLGSAIAGRKQHPTCLFSAFANAMGKLDGKSEIITEGKHVSPYFAALVNGASSHLVEQDDLHNNSIFHPGTVIFSSVLAAAQDLQLSGKELIVAAVAGYEAGIRIGEFLGREHYKVFHTTATVGILAAAVAVGKLLNFNQLQFINVLGTAGTQSAGLWQFLRDGADSKQLHTAKAAADGLLSAYMTNDGLTGALDILEGSQGIAVGMSKNYDCNKISHQLNKRWATLETSIKYYASCRHTHPAADALLSVIKANDLSLNNIERVDAYVHQNAIDVLGRVDKPVSVHQAKFSMGTVLALIAKLGFAGLHEFDNYALNDPDIEAFRRKVFMNFDNEVDAAFPEYWIGSVKVTTTDGTELYGKIDSPKGDPGNPLSKEELIEKFTNLVKFGEAYESKNVSRVIENCWNLESITCLRNAFTLIN